MLNLPDRNDFVLLVAWLLANLRPVGPRAPRKWVLLELPRSEEPRHKNDTTDVEAMAAHLTTIQPIGSLARACSTERHVVHDSG
jgi:hypothetical protein